MPSSLYFKSFTIVIENFYARAKQKVRAFSKHSSFSQSEKEREREREKEIKRQKEKDVEYCCFVFIFKRNDRCLGTF